MKVYLDDERPAPEGWCRVYTAEECMKILADPKIEVEVLSLDHDLGTDKTGYDVLCWIEEQVFVYGYEPPKILLHTANPVGRDKMAQCIRGIDAHLRRTKNVDS